MEMYFRITDAEKAKLIKEHAEATARLESVETQIILAQAEKQQAEIEKTLEEIKKA